jgi:hypothetical protein
MTDEKKDYLDRFEEVAIGLELDKLTTNKIGNFIYYEIRSIQKSFEARIEEDKYHLNSLMIGLHTAEKRVEELEQKISGAVKVLEEAKLYRPFGYYKIWSQVEKRNCESIDAVLSILQTRKREE